jgi:hypothetical protein
MIHYNQNKKRKGKRKRIKNKITMKNGWQHSVLAFGRPRHLGPAAKW